jgi:hypothetical protein
MKHRRRLRGLVPDPELIRQRTTATGAGHGPAESFRRSRQKPLTSLAGLSPFGGSATSFEDWTLRLARYRTSTHHNLDNFRAR